MQWLTSCWQITKYHFVNNNKWEQSLQDEQSPGHCVGQRQQWDRLPGGADETVREQEEHIGRINWTNGYDCVQKVIVMCLHMLSMTVVKAWKFLRLGVSCRCMWEESQLDQWVRLLRNAGINMCGSQYELNSICAGLNMRWTQYLLVSMSAGLNIWWSQYRLVAISSGLHIFWSQYLLVSISSGLHICWSHVCWSGKLCMVLMSLRFYFLAQHQLFSDWACPL